MIFVMLWVVLVAVTAVVMKRRSAEAPVPAPGYVEKSDKPPEDDVRLLNAEFGACTRRLKEFLAASDVGPRSLHVLRPEKTAPRMARYYAINSVSPSFPDLDYKLRNVLHTPAGDAIEGLWAQPDGQQIEAVFFWEGYDWKIDWDAFVRNNSESWALFLTAQGHGEGIFRLLARERIGAGGRDDEYIGLVLYVPRPGHPGEATSASPEVRVKRASALGVRITQALDARQQGTGAYGSKAVNYDPEDMIRLRVRISREGEAERVFEIKELLASHWLEINEPAVKAE